MSDRIQKIFEKVTPPPSSTLLGWEFVSFDPGTNAITVDFDGKEEFLNPAGVIQGGILTAMLDDTMGPALVAATGGASFSTSIDINVSFYAPARVGKLRCVGRVIKAGKTIAFLEAELFNAEGEMIARATSSARMLKFPF